MNASNVNVGSRPDMSLVQEEHSHKLLDTPHVHDDRAFTLQSY